MINQIVFDCNVNLKKSQRIKIEEVETWWSCNDYDIIGSIQRERESEWERKVLYRQEAISEGTKGIRAHKKEGDLSTL